MAKTILGVFGNRDDAEMAIDDLREAGYNPKDISIVMKDTTQGREIANNTGATVANATLSGAATGAIVGGVAGLLVGIGAIAVPGIGGLFIGGPLAAAFGLTGAAATTVEGAATGLLAGGLIGALVGIGLPEEDARMYEDKVKAGAILVAVTASLADADDARMILEDNNAEELRMLSTGAEERTNVHPHSYATMGAKGGRVKKRSRKIIEEE